MLNFSSQKHSQFQEMVSAKSEPGSVEKLLWDKVHTYVPPLRFIPGLLFVGVGNSLSMNSCHTDSDIDLFIITKKNRLWTVRILVTLYFSLLGLRKTSKKHAGQFCLSFFVTEESLNLQNIAIKNDIYLYFWILYMKPIINKEKTYNTFLQINRSWCNFDTYKNIVEANTSYITHRGKAMNSMLLTPFEWLCKRFFLPKTKKSFQKLGKPFGVVISDDMLKFHNQDTREKIRDTLL